MTNMNIYEMSDTWSSGTTTYSAIKMNVTDNGSASDSKILQLQIGSSDKLVLTKAGNVGVGTSSAASSLSVYGGNVQIGSTNTGLVFADGTFQTTAATSTSPGGTSGAVQYNSGSNTFSGDTTKLYVNTTTGNVGIGTSSPIQQLHVQGNTIIKSHIAIGNNATVDYMNTTSGDTASVALFSLISQDSRSGNLAAAGASVLGSIGCRNEYTHTGNTIVSIREGQFFPTVSSSSTGPLNTLLAMHPWTKNYGSGTIANQYAYFCRNDHAGSGLVTALLCAEARNYVASTGSVTNAYNYDCITYLTGSGNITNNYGLLIFGPVASSTGRVTGTNYGIAVANQQVAAVTASSNYNIYSEGATSKNLFDGLVTVGRLEVNSTSLPPNGLYLPATNRVSFTTNTTERMTINSSGNVGIGTSSPTNTLSVYGGNIQIGTSGKGIVFPDGSTLTTVGGYSTQVTVTGATSVKLPTTGNLMSANQTVNITAGYTFTPYDAGTQSSGTFTPVPSNGNYQYYTNNGAHILAAPTTDCAINILITNGSTAGAITFSGYSVGSYTGDSLTTTVDNKFLINIIRINSVSTYMIRAYQ